MNKSMGCPRTCYNPNFIYQWTKILVILISLMSLYRAKMFKHYNANYKFECRFANVVKYYFLTCVSLLPPTFSYWNSTKQSVNQSAVKFFSFLFFTQSGLEAVRDMSFICMFFCLFIVLFYSGSTHKCIHKPWGWKLLHFTAVICC